MKRFRVTTNAPERIRKQPLTDVFDAIDETAAIAQFVKAAGIEAETADHVFHAEPVNG